jgi:hypothetical protein
MCEVLELLQQAALGLVLGFYLIKHMICFECNVVAA